MATYNEVLAQAVKNQVIIGNATKRINAAKTGTSNDLFMVAQSESGCSVDTFLEQCNQAEQSYKAAKRNALIPKQWTQAKSNIKGAMVAGLKLADYETESSLRKALLDMRKAAKVQHIGDKVAALYSKLDKLGLSVEATTALEDVVGMLEIMVATADVTRTERASVDLQTAAA